MMQLLEVRVDVLRLLQMEPVIESFVAKLEHVLLPLDTEERQASEGGMPDQDQRLHFAEYIRWDVRGVCVRRRDAVCLRAQTG